jgi:hypothetical protein
VAPTRSPLRTSPDAGSLYGLEAGETETEGIESDNQKSMRYRRMRLTLSMYGLEAGETETEGIESDTSEVHEI